VIMVLQMSDMHNDLPAPVGAEITPDLPFW